MFQITMKHKKYFLCNKWIKNCWIISIILLQFINVTAQNKINATLVPDESGPLSEVQTAIGLEVSIPCDLIPTGSIYSDAITLVIWYKEGILVPIYTFDARGKRLEQAIHWMDQNILKTKAHFHYDTNPPALRIRNVEESDAGLYRCRVDFQKSPTRNWRINLTVLIPPSRLVVLDNLGAAVMDGIIGPYHENINVNITCLSSGGQPAPRVSWWKEHALIDDSFQILVDGSVRNVLHLTKLDRRDLHSVYTCQASNGHVVPPLSSTVKLEMRLPPLYVRLQGLNHPLISGVRTQISCSSAGARPSPQIIWNKGGIVMRGASQTTSTDGNVTVSEIVFLPIPEDNGKLVTCSVTTETIAGDPGLFLKDSRILDVKHAPIVSLTLGAPLDANNLVKGSDVYLDCEVRANPPAKKVEWFHKDEQLHSSRGIIVANQTLVLQGISKNTHGQYMCRASNLQGTVGSNEVYLDVKYPPVCSAESTIIRAAIKQTVNVSCDVDSNPMTGLTYKWMFNNSLENIIDLPSPLDIHPTKAMEDAYQDGSVYSNNLYHHKHGRSRDGHHQQQQQRLSSQQQSSSLKIPEKLSEHIYPYEVETFQHFGTIMCTAENYIGKSETCIYHIMAAEIPEPVRNCSSYNNTANSVAIACIAGKDGGIQQYFYVDVTDEQNRSVLYNVTFKNSDFTLKRLPSDTTFRIKITAFNLQGSSNPFRMRVKTLQAPLLRTASSTAVLVQLTPLLGVLVGAVATLLLVAVCIVVFVKFRTKKSITSTTETNTTEADKGSAEPLSRNMGSSMDDKNPDVVPQENSEDEFMLEEKAFDRLNLEAHRIIYTHNLNNNNNNNNNININNNNNVSQRHHSQNHQQHEQIKSPISPPPFTSSLHHHSNFLSSVAKPPSFNSDISLTTNPAYAMYNSPQRRPMYTAPPPLLSSTSNIYTRIPTRTFLQPYGSNSDTQQTSPTSSTYGITMPLLLTSSGTSSPLNNVDEKS